MSLLTEYPIVSLHPHFSIQECTFMSDEKGVIYSPVNGETLLCEHSLIDFLMLAESKPEVAYLQLVQEHPTHVTDIIEQLANLEVIEIKGYTRQTEY